MVLGPGAVLGPASMWVHGVDGLRVMDSSAMPQVANDEIYAPVRMISEKTIDLVLGNEPLAMTTGESEFCRHRHAQRSGDRRKDPGMISGGLRMRSRSPGPGHILTRSLRGSYHDRVDVETGIRSSATCTSKEPAWSHSAVTAPRCATYPIARQRSWV
jgi:hypothetical protein